jgi:kynureninase
METAPAMPDPTLDDVLALDAADPLAACRARFALPPGVIYLDGNSLGALPVATAARVADTVQREWGQGLIGSWNSADWIGAPLRLGARIAGLIGAHPDEVLVADSTSANLFKLLCAAVVANPGRRTVLTEPGNFPTDLYMVQGLTRLIPGLTIRLAERDAIVDAIDDDVAVVMLTQVHYKTGHRLDMAAVTAAAQARGALMLWDLSHSAGAIAVDLNAAGADLAVGCGYKYLNGGPGAPAYLYVARRHQDRLQSPLAGWMGHARPFDFDDDYAPAPGIARFACGTPPILGLAALEAGLDTLDGIDRAALHAKGQALASLFIAVVEAGDCGVKLVTPRDPAQRGSHVSFACEHGFAVVQCLIARGVIGDFRAPDVMRFGFAPLYLTYQDVWHAAQTLVEILQTRAWDRAEFKIRAKVT